MHRWQLNHQSVAVLAVLTGMPLLPDELSTVPKG